MRFMLRSKIHRATVTEADPDYEGSITLAEDLLEVADILPYEQVHCWNVTRGSRFTTYAITGARGSDVVCVNGAAARLVEVGDIIIVGTFGEFTEEEARRHKPRLIMVDAHNRVAHIGPEVPGPQRRGEMERSPKK